MRVVIVEPGKASAVKAIKNGLAAMQTIAGGTLLVLPVCDVSQ